MYVCICNAITERQIKETIASGSASTLTDLQSQLGVATCCGCCADIASSYLGATQESNVQSITITPVK